MDPENDPLQLSPNDRDLMIRTIIGEAGSDPSAPGVAAVIANRMRQTGQSAGQIVLAPGQFEPWSTRSKELMSYSPTDPAYKAAAKVVDDAISGKTPDPTGGATKFYSPSAQKALGRQPPAWDDGTGQPIGKQLFFGGQQSDPLAGFEIAPGAKSAGAPADDPLAGFEIAPSKATKAASSAPAAAAPAASSAPDDPLAGFDIAASAPPLVKAAAPPPPTSAMSDPGGGVEFMNSFPVVGPALVKGGAAIDALTSPLSGYLGGAVPNIPGATFSDRYANRTAALEQARKAFVENHPTAATATDVAGGIVGAAPLMAAAPAAFGLGEGPLAARMAIGALSNSALTGADTAVRGGSASDVLRSGELGLAGGAAGPLIGAGLGKIVSGVGSALSGVKPGVANIAETMREIGLTPIQARAALADLGPFGTLADVDPALTTKAGALASLGGQPTSILKRAMLDRAAGADQRVNDVVTGSLGQRPDLTAAQAAIKQDASTAAKPFYDAARANPQPMDVTPILADIDAKLPNASGSVQSALQTAKSYLTREISTVPGPNGTKLSMIVPKDDPQALMGARQALDDFIESRGDATTTAGKNALGAAKNVRQQLDAVLKSDPNIAQGDAAFSGHMGRLDALNEGTEIFKPGTRIEDMQRSLAAKTPEQADAMRTGALSAVHDALDNARGGDFAAAKSLFSKSTANRAKLDALFPNAGKVFDSLDAEATMRATEQQVARNSATAERTAASREFTPDTKPNPSEVLPLAATVLGGPAAGVGTEIASRGFRGAVSALSAASNARLRDQTARALGATGPLQSALLDQIEHAFTRVPHIAAAARGGSALTNALSRSALAALPPWVLPHPYGAGLLSALAGSSQ